MDPHGEDAGDRVRRAHDLRHGAVPHALGVFHRRDGLERAPTRPVEVPERSMLPVQLDRLHPRELGGRRVGAVATDRRVVLARERELRAAGVLRTPHVRLHQVRAALEREGDRPLLGVLAEEQLVRRLEEPPLVPVGGREVEREPRIGTGEAAVDVAMWHRRRALLVDVDVRRVEAGVLGLFGDQHGSAPISDPRRVVTSARERVTVPSNSAARAELAVVRSPGRGASTRHVQEVPMTGVRLPTVRMRGRLLEGFV